MFFSCQQRCAHHPFPHPCWARAHCIPGPSSTTLCGFPLDCQAYPGFQTYGWDPVDTIRAEATMLTISIACPRKGPPVLYSFGVLNPQRNCVHTADSPPVCQKVRQPASRSWRAAYCSVLVPPQVNVLEGSMEGKMSFCVRALTPLPNAWQGAA